MSAFARGVLFCASALLAAAATHPSIAAAAFTSTHAGTGCFSLLEAASSGWLRSVNGMANGTTSANALVCAAPEESATTLAATLVTVSGTDLSASLAPSATLCSTYWDGSGYSCTATVTDSPSNVGAYTLFLWDVSPWHGTGTRQYDYPIVYTSLTPSPSTDPPYSTLNGITVYY